jgi:WD40 repeat protein
MLHGHSSSINSVKICTNSNFAVTGSDDNKTILWNLQTGDSVIVYEGYDAVTAVDVLEIEDI